MGNNTFNLTPVFFHRCILYWELCSVGDYVGCWEATLRKQTNTVGKRQVISADIY